MKDRTTVTFDSNKVKQNVITKALESEGWGLAYEQQDGALVFTREIPGAQDKDAVGDAYALDCFTGHFSEYVLRLKYKGNYVMLLLSREQLQEIADVINAPLSNDQPDIVPGFGDFHFVDAVNDKMRFFTQRGYDHVHAGFFNKSDDHGTTAVLNEEQLDRVILLLQAARKAMFPKI
jgi:hypothetical protein